MNNGANIQYKGASDLRRVAGDILTTNYANRTELRRTYFIRKDKTAEALRTLRPDYRAEGYTNLYLWNPPAPRITEAYTYFDCVFHGVLSQQEGGRGSGYEKVDKSSNIRPVNQNPISVQFFLSTVMRFFYTIPTTAETRILDRVIPLPRRVEVRTNVQDKKPTIIKVDGSLFYWSPIDVPRENYGRYDEVIESWELLSKAAQPANG